MEKGDRITNFVLVVNNISAVVEGVGFMVRQSLLSVIFKERMCFARDGEHARPIFL
jgi:uncharacterized integral membrane protein